MNRILVSILGLAALAISMSAAGQTADGGAKLSHPLPLLIDGGGYRSILMVTNAADQANRCTLNLLDGRLDASDFATHRSVTWNGSSATIVLPNSESRVSFSGRNLASSEIHDSAVLNCDLPAVVRVMVTLSQNDAVGAAAVLPSAQTGERFGIPVLPRFGDYLLAAQNRQSGGANCRIELLDESGAVVAERSHDFAGSASVVRYLSDLASAPADFASGSATVTCDRQIAVTGLLAGSALSGLPPAVLPSVRTGAGFAPIDSAAFDRLVVGKRFVGANDSRSYIEFPAAGQFVDVEPGVRYTGTYTYVNTGPDTGTLTANYDADGDTCTNELTFTSATTGSTRYACTGGDTGVGNWRLDNSPPSTGGGDDGGDNTEIPTSPINVQYVRDGSTAVVSWDAVQGADYYNIYHDDFWYSGCRLNSLGSTSFCDELAANVTGTSYIHADPDDDNNYYWVVACNADGCSKIDTVFSNPFSFSGDRAALVALYHATDGPNWNDNTNWLTDAPLGQWFGVTTNPNGRVYELNLPDNNLSGPIPSEFGALTGLQNLQLQINAISGKLPPELANLASLQHLVLGFNDLSGPIPPELAELSQLRTLSLWVNSLTGPIPAELGKLTGLRTLRLGHNMLNGQIPPELGDLANVEHLWLENNDLSGIIPLELANLPKLKELLLPAGVCVSADLLAWAVEFRVSVFECDLEKRVWPSVLMRGDSNGLSLALPDDLRQSPTVSVSDSSVVAVSAAADGWLELVPRGIGTAELELTPAGGGESAALRVVVRAPVGTFGIDIVMDRPAPVTYEEALMRGADWWSAVLDGTEWPDRESHCHNDRARSLADELLIHAWIDRDTEAGGYALTCFRNDDQRAFDPGGGAVVASPPAATPFLIRHEIAHLLGLVLWGPESELVTEGEGTFYFTGPRAVKAFRERGGDPALPGVPFDGVHWQYPSVEDFLGVGSDGTISAAALADMGFTVNLEKAAVPPEW